MGIFDTLLGTAASDTANAAAQNTFGKQQNAIRNYNQDGNTYFRGMMDTSKQFNPYVRAGGSGLDMLLSGLGLGGQAGSEAFTNSYRALPGYQSGLDTGMHAANSALNAGNMGQSGRALKELYRYGSDYEDQRAGSYLDRLTGMAGMGQQATAQKAGMQGQGYGGRLQQRGTGFGGAMNAAGTIGQGMVAGATAESQALTNLMQTGAYLGGMALGGPMGGAMGQSMFGAAKPATGGSMPIPYQNTFMGPR